MKRTVVAALSILAMGAGVGWKLAGHAQPSAPLSAVSLSQHSEHSNASPTDALARVRIRISASDSGVASRATADQVPQIALATE